MLNHSELANLSLWKPISPDFGMDSFVYKTKILPIFQEIEDKGKGKVHLLTGGNSGLSNYASAFVYYPNHGYGQKSGLYIYLSLLGPFAALGRGTVTFYVNGSGSSMIEPSNVLTEQELKSDLEHLIHSLIKQAGFQILNPMQASEQLPADIIPFEYCLNHEPWDKLFHVLFSDTD